MAIKGIFLDLGDTFRIIDENPEYIHAARQRIADICGSKMDADEYYDYLNSHYDKYREFALKYMCEAPEDVLWTRWMVPELDREYVAAHAQELTYCWRKAKGERVVVPHGIETVRELVARGYKVGIISDLVGTIEVDEWLDKDGIRDLFSTVQQSSVTMLRKPHPGIFFMALKEAGVLPQDAAFVGDNLNRDIVGAKVTGFTATVATEYDPVKKPLKINEENCPDCIIHDFAELLNVFPGNGEFCPDKAERRTK